MQINVLQTVNGKSGGDRKESETVSIYEVSTDYLLNVSRGHGTV